jgi:hypothetical protein|nr:MAG TPA: tail tape measure [Caudoviricetes sp.]
MPGNLLDEYLVGLGFQVDRPGFTEFIHTLQAASQAVNSATGAWTREFVKAAGIVTTALASVTTAAAGVAKAAANQDLAMEKLARRMMVSKDAAWQMKQATDALGESISDIVITPELMNRYQKLVADGRQMKPGGDFAVTMKGFRDLMFEFTRLKQEVSYAMTWVGYYLLKYLNRPLAEAQARFRSFNDAFVRNMAAWTEKLARAAVYIINIGLHFFDLIKSITSAAYDMWAAFPKGVKIATAAMAAFFAVLKMSPIGRMITLVSALLLLVDDYFGYFEGKQALFGKYWETLRDGLTRAQQTVIAFSNAIGDMADDIRSSDTFQTFCDVIVRLGKALYALGSGVVGTVVKSVRMLIDAFGRHETAQKFAGVLERLWRIISWLTDAVLHNMEIVSRWLDEIEASETVREFLDAVSELASAVLDLTSALLDLVYTALKAFFGGMGTTEPVYGFRDAVRAVVKIITMMVRILSFVIELLAKFFKMMASNQLFRDFWDGLGRAVKTFGNILDVVINKALDKLGKLGKALKCLVNGDFEGAKEALLGASTKPGIGQAGESAAEMAEYLIANGIPVTAAMGIMGNIGGESGYDPAAYNPDDNGAPSGGLAQWHAERFDRLQDFAADRGTDWRDRKTQLDYLIYELQTDYADVLERMKNASSIEEATEIFLRDFEKPQFPDAVLGERVANARKVAEEVTRRANKPKLKQPPITGTDIYPAYPDNPWDRVLPPPKGISGFVGSVRRLGRGMRTLVSQADPVLLGGMQSGARYATYGGSSQTIVNNINVGGVTVTHSNASPEEIGNAVADKSMEKLNAKGQYLLQSRTLTGGPNVV